MSDTLVDSSIVIDFLRGRRQASEYLDGLRRTRSLVTHVVVVAEVLVGTRNRDEQTVVDQFFREFQVLCPDESDSRTSLDLLKRYRLAHGVGWLDCIIAATCLRYGMAIATLNVKHFAEFDDLQVRCPY